MLVLDEQLLGRGVEAALARWYRGTICYIHELRPQTVVKDDAIPGILRSQPQPTFLTINESDFWQRVRPDRQFCMICVALPDSRVSELPALVQATLHVERFRTKAQRMGHILRVTRHDIQYYQFPTMSISTLEPGRDETP